MAAMHTDTISEYKGTSQQGVPYGNIKIPLLLFQDDIVKLDANAEKLQQSNLILEHYQLMNRMAFHPDKTKVMNNKQEIEVTLNKNQVTNTRKYKYLGDIISIDGKHTELINERRNVCAGTVAELVSINYETQQYNLIASVQYLEGVIIPKLLLNSETWNNIKKKDEEELEKIQSQSLKRLIQLPYTTPTRGLYNELGIMTVTNRINIKKLIFLWKLLHKNEDRLSRMVLEQQHQLPGNTWVKETLNIAEEIGIIDMEEIREYTEDEWKKIVKQRIWVLENRAYKLWAEKSKKCNHMKDEDIKMKEYIKVLNPQEAKLILDIRLGMLQVKENFHNMHEDNICRICKVEIEDSKHFINCTAKIAGEEQNLQNLNEIWSLNEISNLIEVAPVLYKVIKNNKIFEYSG